MPRPVLVLIAGLVAFLVAFPGLLRSPKQASFAEPDNLYLEQRCTASNGVNVWFSWTGSDRDAVQQWVDVSLFDNGWRAGTYLGSGPHRGQAWWLPWEGLEQYSRHYVRINQLMPGGVWETSPTFVVYTRYCGPSVSRRGFECADFRGADDTRPLDGSACW